MNISLKFPTIDDKEAWLDYVEEYKKTNPESSLAGFLKTYDYELWLNNVIDEHNGVVKQGRVAASVYFIMEGTNIIGHISIRHNLLTEELIKYGGHIGYGIRPSKRNKGYGKETLKLGLLKCQDLAIDKVMLACKSNNLSMIKIIEENDAVFDEEVHVADEKSNYKKYWKQLGK